MESTVIALKFVENKVLLYCLLNARHCLKSFIYVNSRNHHDNSVRKIFLIPIAQMQRDINLLKMISW